MQIHPALWFADRHSTSLAGNFAALYSMDSSRGATDVGVAAYPPRGYMAARFFGPRHAWSVSLDPKRYEAGGDVNVKVWQVGGAELRSVPSPMGSPMELSIMKVERGGYGVPLCIIFHPAGASVTPGKRYWVSIDGVTDKSKPGTKFEYLVEFE